MTDAYDPALVNELLAYAADHTHEQIVEKLAEVPQTERRRIVHILAVATVNGDFRARALTDQYDGARHLHRKQRRRIWWQANRPKRAQTRGAAL